MNLTSAEFVDLCKQLRALGSTRVEVEGFCADFGAELPKQAPGEPETAPGERFARPPTRGEAERDRRARLEADREKMLGRV